MADYPANAADGVEFPAPLDPDISSGSGVPYLFDFRPSIGSAATISSATVAADAGLTVVGNAAVGTASEDATYPDVWTFTETASGAHAVQVRVYAAATARVGQRLGITVTATDSDSVPHVRTGYVTIRDR